MTLILWQSLRTFGVTNLRFTSFFRGKRHPDYLILLKPEINEILGEGRYLMTVKAILNFFIL
jgi:hypothetical protein